MNKEKALKRAKSWLANSPGSLDPDEVLKVLDALGFELKREVKKDTTYIYTHACLADDNITFKFNALYVSISHAKGKKSEILIGSIKAILKALTLHRDLKNH